MNNCLGDAMSVGETIYQRLKKQGISRRDFLRLSGLLAAVIGLKAPSPLAGSDLQGALAVDSRLAQEIAQALERKSRKPLIWLEFQDCAGCSESLTRSASPSFVNLVLNTLTMDYHETLSAAAGFQADQARDTAMQKYFGQYVLVVEGSIPIANGGVYCTVGGRTALDLFTEAAKGAALIIAAGSCASFGGLSKANPNPTDAKGVQELGSGQVVVNVPGCPAIPEVIASVIARFVVLNELPKLDILNRPTEFYEKTVHDFCLRRPFFETSKFAYSFNDEGARSGWCLYKLGCQGRVTYNACASIKWNQGLSFTIQSGHPCLGCSQPGFWDRGGVY
jgi:hydrogenase small subunit